MINRVETFRFFLKISAILSLFMLQTAQLGAVTLKEARQFYATGEYAKAAESCKKAIEDKQFDSGWRLLLMRSYLVTGQLLEAKKLSETLLQDYRYRYNAEALWLFHLSFEANGESEKSKQMLQIIMQFLEGQRGVSDESTIVFIGRALLKSAAADPKQIKENLYDRVLKSDPENREALLAVGELALAKRDFKLAGQTLTRAIGFYPEDADLLYGLAKAYS